MYVGPFWGSEVMTFEEISSNLRHIHVRTLIDPYLYGMLLKKIMESCTNTSK